VRAFSALLLCLCLSGACAAHAQDSPSAEEDAREERLKILRAADQMEMLQRNSEAANAKVTKLEATVEKLEQNNKQLTAQVKALQEAMLSLKETQAKQQKTLLEEVRKLLGNKTSPPASAGTTKETPEEKKDGKWYVHVVEQGQTLSAIAQAYRDNGVEVSVEDIRKANDIKQDNLIRVGQKLYIPKS